MSRIARWFANAMPTREAIEANRWLAPVAHRVLHPALWRFHRRSVPRAVALGIVVGVLVPVAQTLVAALLALPVRANVPVAAGVTLLTNPLTTPPLWFAAYWVGGRLLGLDMHGSLAADVGGEAGDVIRWLFSNAAPALLLGLVVIALGGAALGYLATRFGWSWWVAHKWRRRARGRSAARTI